MAVSEIVQQIAGGLVSGLTTFGQGLGHGISDIVTAMMFQTTGTGESAVTTLSPFFIGVIAFGAVALAVGLTTLIFSWLSSLGHSR